MGAHRHVSLLGAWAPAQSPRGSVLVIHENRGLTDHIRNVAGRMAANGWSALAIDLRSEEGSTAKVGASASTADSTRASARPAPPPARRSGRRG